MGRGINFEMRIKFDGQRIVDQKFDDIKKMDSIMSDVKKKFGGDV